MDMEARLDALSRELSRKTSQASIPPPDLTAPPPRLTSQTSHPPPGRPGPNSPGPNSPGPNSPGPPPRQFPRAVKKHPRKVTGWNPTRCPSKTLRPEPSGQQPGRVAPCRALPPANPRASLSAPPGTFRRLIFFAGKLPPEGRVSLTGHLDVAAAARVPPRAQVRLAPAAAASRGEAVVAVQVSVPLGWEEFAGVRGEGGEGVFPSSWVGGSLEFL